MQNNKHLYLRMIISSIGFIFLFLAFFELALTVESIRRSMFTFAGIAGYIITVQYIYYLEKKLGIMSKLIWIRAGVVISFLGTIYFLMYR